MSGVRIVVIGSANLDLVVAADQIPRPGETLLGGGFETFAGGKGANQAVAAARAGGHVAMVGHVGDDDFGKRLRAGLEDAGVGVDTVARVAGPSGVALIVTAASGENSIVVAPGANASVDAGVVTAALARYPAATQVLAQLETPLDGVLAAASGARERGATFILDPAPARALPGELLRLTDWITPNESEARALLGATGDEELEPVEAARAIARLGPRNVILKRSSKGAWLLLAGREPVFVPPFAVTAVDTTAAGDAFNGAFAVGLSEGRDPVDAARFAAMAAAISVTRRGAQPSMPTRAEIDQRLPPA
jgi:ribokinase